MTVKVLELASIGIGGAIGSILRYALSGWILKFPIWGSFPGGTLVVNVLGCAAVGLLGGISESRAVFGPTTRLFILIGLLGGFTTFSTFSYETLTLVRAGETAKAALNAAANLLLCLSCTWIGFGVGSR
jgi:CrcB protein